MKRTRQFLFPASEESDSFVAVSWDRQPYWRSPYWRSLEMKVFDGFDTVVLNFGHPNPPPPGGIHGPASRREVEAAKASSLAALGVLRGAVDALVREIEADG